MPVLSSQMSKQLHKLRGFLCPFALSLPSRNDNRITENVKGRQRLLILEKSLKIQLYYLRKLQRRLS